MLTLLQVVIACLNSRCSPDISWWPSLESSGGDEISHVQVEDLGLSAQPHVSPVELLPDLTSSLVIIASDGVWDVASPDRVVEVGPDLAICWLHAWFGLVQQ